MTSAGITSPLTDALGSVVAETNAAGTVAANLSYEPYGKSTITGTVSGNSQQYTGRENDGTGLYYYRARYYNPATGRFMSEDPIGFAGGADTYTYANGNPVLLIDPFGLWSWGDPLPDGLANSVVGFGDGVYRALTFGLGNLNEFRNAIGIYGGVDLCSSTYSYGKAWGLRLGQEHYGPQDSTAVRHRCSGRAAAHGRSRLMPARLLTKRYLVRCWTQWDQQCHAGFGKLLRRLLR